MELPGRTGELAVFLLNPYLHSGVLVAAGVKNSLWVDRMSCSERKEKQDHIGVSYNSLFFKGFPALQMDQRLNKLAV